MDLVVITLTVFLGGIVLLLATLWARFGPRVNSVQSLILLQSSAYVSVGGDTDNPSRPTADYSCEQ